MANEINQPEKQNDNGAQGIPIWFWIASGLALVWNLLGLMAFVVQVTMSEEALQALPEAQQELYENMPSWVTIAFAVAVIAGVIGCVGLLMKKKWAFPVFVLSLLGILGQQTYMFFLSDTLAVMGMGSIGFPIFVLVVAILLIWFANFATGKRWLN